MFYRARRAIGTIGAKTRAKVACIGRSIMDILIVEDNVSLARTLGRVLAKQGYSSRSVATFREALRLGPDRPRAALIQLTLPDRNRIDLAGPVTSALTCVAR